ncbi:MAG: divalent metal cation transporter [Bacteroidetes bacterium]|nr:divalent metal cation transporter [Bacteroidota bacterium]
MTFVMMAAVQFISAKASLVTGKGLAGVLRQYYQRKLLYPAVFGLLIANTINLGTDIGAIAAAANPFVPISISWMIVPIAVIILATGATLFKAGTTNIQSAADAAAALRPLADAAAALRPLAGDAAGILFGLGIVGSGFLAVPVLAGSAAYAVAEVFDWRTGLD